MLAVMLVQRWHGPATQCGCLALLILACSLAIPAEVLARPGGGSSYSGPGGGGSHSRPGSTGSSSSDSWSTRHRGYGSSSSDDEDDWKKKPSDSQRGERAGEEAATEDHQAGLSFDVSRHMPLMGDAEWWELEGFERGFALGYESRADELHQAQGWEAAVEDREAGLEYDLTRHELSITGKSEREQQQFRIGYRDSFQHGARQNRECIEAYLLPHTDAEHARRAGERHARNVVEAHPDLDASYWQSKPICETSVMSAAQAKAFQRSFSAEVSKAIAREGSLAERMKSRARQRIVFEVILSALALATVSVLVVVVIRRERRVRAGWRRHVPAPAPSPKGCRILLRDILAADPNFSVISFEDYAVRLYAQLHREAAPGRDIESMRCYATTTVRKKLRAFHQNDPTVPIVLVASLGIKELTSVVIPDGSELQVIVCEVESNVTTGAPGDERTLYLRQEVDFARRLGVQTRAPDGVTTFGCPICHATFASRDAIRCDFCGNEATDGRVVWLVNYVGTVEQAETAPALTANHPELGNQLPTVVDPGTAAGWQALCAEDPTVTQESIAARLNVIYHGLNAGWVAIDERQLRPHVSDGLFDYFRYWLAAYRRHGLKNQLEDMRLTGWELANVTRDGFYDAITVRIYATGIDYTVRADSGAVVSGSSTTPRPYTEYWTLIRGRGVRSAPRGAPVCPHCGASLAINMGGHCEYCGVHVTTGQFDWVLSKIEQDDTYGRGRIAGNSAEANHGQAYTV